MIYLHYKDTKTFGHSFSFLLIFKTLRASYLQVGNFSYKETTILEEGVFSLSYGLLTSSYRSHPEYRAFLDENKKELKSLLWSSYYKSIRKNSLGKTYSLNNSYHLRLVPLFYKNRTAG